MTSLEEKQEYLRTAILNTGYDPISFKDFLDQKRDRGGEDLDLWSLDELKVVVLQFRDAQDKAAAASKPQLPLKTEGPDKWQFQSSRPCIQYSNKVLQSAKLKVGISSFQRKEGGGIFSPTHIVYRVQTTGLKLSVWRRYNDFIWLRETLARLYPAHIIPPLPPKGAVRSFELDFIKMRMRKLELFLQQVVSEPDFLNDLVYSFLGEQNPEALARLQTEPLAGPSPHKFAGVRSKDGTAKLEMSDRSTAFVKRCETMFGRQEDILLKLKQSAERMERGFRSVAEQAAMSSRLFVELRNSVKSFNELSRATERNQILEQVYAGISNHMVDFCLRVKDQHSILKNFFTNFLENQFDVHHQIIKVIDFHGKELAALDKGSEKLKRMKQAKERSSKLEELGKQLAEQKERFAYINATVRSQVESAGLRIAALYCENFSQMAKLQIHAISRKQMQLLDLQIGYSQLMQGKKVVGLKQGRLDEWIEGGNGFEL